MDNVFLSLSITQEEWEKITEQCYNDEDIQQVVERWNLVQVDLLKDTDEELVKCDYCDGYNKWGDCNTWECEKCAKIFCNTCLPDYEYNGSIHCKECRGV